MKRPEIKIKTLGGPPLEFFYGSSTGELYEKGKIGVSVSFGRGGMIIVPEDVEKLIEFFATCDSLLRIDNSDEMCKKRKANRQYFADTKMK
jgi:hypothetical protein